MDRPSFIAPLILAGCVAAPAARAQTSVPARPIEAGVADVGPLARSLRITPIDLREPTRFDAVYRTHDDQLMRVDGGLRAVFPRSVYRATRSGAVAMIPPGTVFYIGEPPAAAPGLGDFATGPIGSLGPDARGTVVSTLIDARLETAAVSGRVAQRLNTALGGHDQHAAQGPIWTSDPSRAPTLFDPSAPATLWNNDRFRARRIESLLTRAAMNR